MRFHALATDYDGTLATEGHVDPATIRQLERLRASGRKSLLVTGREWRDLVHACDCLSLLDAVIAENGAIHSHPKSGKWTRLATPPPPSFVARLRRRGCRTAD